MNSRLNMPLIAISLVIAALSATQASAQVPASLAVPDAIAVATLHAEGAHIYECKPGPDSNPVWQFREPVPRWCRKEKPSGAITRDRIGSPSMEARCGERLLSLHRARRWTTSPGSGLTC